MTGADSPVIADSSTLAMPSMTSPSPGMVSPATTTTTVTERELRGGDLLLAAVGELPAGDWSRCVSWRRVAACALPRPSATASARFAKTTVSHSQTTTDQPKALGSSTALTVAKTAPISTTNITGDLTITRGSSLRTASGSEVSSWRGSSSPPATRVGRGRRTHDSPSASGPSASTGKKVRPATMSDDADEHGDEQPTVGGQGALGWRAPCCCSASDPARARTSSIGTKRPTSMARARAML